MIELIHTLKMKLLEQNIVAKIWLAKHENNVMLFFNYYKKNMLYITSTVCSWKMGFIS